MERWALAEAIFKDDGDRKGLPEGYRPVLRNRRARKPAGVLITKSSSLGTASR